MATNNYKKIKCAIENLGWIYGKLTKKLTAYVLSNLIFQCRIISQS